MTRCHYCSREAKRFTVLHQQLWCGVCGMPRQTPKVTDPESEAIRETDTLTTANPEE